MNKEEPQNNSIKLALARVLQIKNELQQLDAETQDVWATLTKSEQATQTDIVTLENKYQAARLELYNEVVQIENNQINSCAGQSTEISREDIIALSNQLNLGETLKKLRLTHDVEAEPLYLGLLCRIGCDTCIYDCTTCVSTCGLNGGSSSCTGLAPGIVGTPSRPR